MIAIQNEYAPRCVKCGRSVGSIELQLAQRLGTAPACGSCEDDVLEECGRNYGMWPHDWYGHWIWSKDEPAYVPNETDPALLQSIHVCEICGLVGARLYTRDCWYHIGCWFPDPE